MRRTLAVALVFAVVIGSLAGATRVGTGAAPPEVDDRETFTVHTESIIMQEGGQICAEALQDDVNEVTIRNAQLEGTTMYYDGENIDKVISLPSSDLDGELVLYTNGENSLVNTLAQLGMCIPIDQPIPVTLEVYYLTAESLDVDDMEIQAGEGIADDAPEPGGLALSDLLGNLSLSQSTGNESDGSDGNPTLGDGTDGNGGDVGENVTDTVNETTDAVDDTTDTVDDTTDQTNDSVDDTTDTVNDTVDDTTDTVNDTVDDPTETVDDPTDTVDDTTDTVNDTVDDTTDTVDDTTDTVNDTVDDTTDTVNDTVDDTTDTVNDTIDDSDDNSTDSLTDTVNETTSTVTDTVNDTVDTVSDTVNETLTGGSDDDSGSDDGSDDDEDDDDGLLSLVVAGFSGGR